MTWSYWRNVVGLLKACDVVLLTKCDVGLLKECDVELLEECCGATEGM